jgi:vacuolar-type H+-ATPase subunit E/Vma4
MAEARQRSRLLAARELYVDKLAKEAAARLRTAIQGDKARYPALLMGLIKQAMARLTGEQACEVRCRPADLELARQATAAAAEKIKAAGGPALATTVTADAALADSMGGVIVTAMAGRIRCNNTLEARLETVLHDLTPVVRDTLFPSARAEVKTKPAVYFPHQQAHGTAAPAPHQPAAAAVGGGGAAAAPAAAVATPAAAAAAAAPAAAPAAAAAHTQPAAAAPAAAKAAAPAAADPFVRASPPLSLQRSAPAPLRPAAAHTPPKPLLTTPLSLSHAPRFLQAF